MSLDRAKHRGSVGAHRAAASMTPDRDHHNDHIVQFYDDDHALTAVVAEFLAAGLTIGDSVVVIAREPRRTALAQRLRDRGLNVAHAVEAGTLTLLDAQETLAMFMQGAMPDWDRFRAAVGSVLEAATAASASGNVRAYGEMVDVLWFDGNRRAALRLEEMWNDIQTTHSFALFCAYAMANFYKAPADLQDVCATHTHVHRPGNGDRAGNPDYTPTSPPPQHARRLAAEVAQRAEIEAALRESLRELRHKEVELKRLHDELDDFIENAAIGIHRVGPDGTILWVNKAELRLLGYEAQEYVGRNIAEFHADKPVIDDLLARLNRNEELQNREVRLIAKDGSVRHVSISSNVYSRDGQFVHTRCFTRDITDRKRFEEALQENERQLQLITDALPTLVSFVDARERYRFVNAGYERWFGHNKTDVVGRHVKDVLGTDAYERIRPHVAAALSGQTVTYEAHVPYRTGGHRFVEATYIPHVTSGGAVAGFVALVADISERKRHEQVRAVAARRTERLLKVTGSIAEAVTREQVFEALVDSVAAAVNASSSGLWLLDEDGRTRLVRSLGYPEAAKKAFDGIPLDTSPSFPALDAIRLAKPIWIGSQQELLACYPHLAASVTPGRSYRIACLPLVVQGRALGALGLMIEEAQGDTDDERDFLLLIARYAGQALERLRLLEAEQRSRGEADAAATRMGVLSRASRSFGDAAPELASLLEAVVEEVARDYSQGAALTLVDADGETLKLAAVRHYDPHTEATLRTLAESTQIKVGEGISGRVAQTGEPVFLPAVAPEELLALVPSEYRNIARTLIPRSLLVVPLRTRGKVIGTLAAVRYGLSPAFSGHDRELLEELAKRAATAIENSRLHNENARARSRAEELYRFAQAVVAAERIEQVFDAALSAIERGLGADRAAILLFDRDGVMRFKASRGLSEDYRRAVEGHSPWPRDVVGPQPVIVRDVNHDPAMDPYRTLFRTEGIGALGFIPLVAPSRGQLLGKFMVYYDRAHEFSSSEVELAQSIANHLSSVVTRFVAIEQRERLVTDLRETVRLNELFAGVLAHDLRNPLSAIITAARLAMMRDENDQVTKPLRRVLLSGERMTRMIEQLLDFTRLRVAGGLELVTKQTDLYELCRQVINELEDAHPAWRMRIDRTGDTSGAWDSDRLMQVFSNLAGNAVQHGDPSGGLVIHLDGSNPEFVAATVHNHGRIPEELLPSLFDPFRGTQHRPSNGTSGLGLGLFITKAGVLAHGGSIDVTSGAERGTAFVVRLPRSVSEPLLLPSSRPAISAGLMAGVPLRTSAGSNAGTE